jgi:uncharacterized repeat protein (TIGR01451 family)
LSLISIGSTYSLWSKKLYIKSKVNTGNWDACIKIRKILDGAYYYNADINNYEGPSNQIAIAANYPTFFRLIIEVKNCANVPLDDVVVTDTIKNVVAPVSWSSDKGEVKWDPYPITYSEFHFDDLEWMIGKLNAGEAVNLTIWIQTLPNPSGSNTCKPDKFAPTSGDEEDGQDIVINGCEDDDKLDGAKVVARSDFGCLSATTDGITIYIVDDGESGNGLGLILTPLPYSTPWARDKASLIP